MSDKPNILLFFTDDQRYDTIAALGNGEIRTPHLDKFTRRGTTFTRAHIPGGTCGAVCMPSRAMLHTGRTLFHIDREGQDIPAEHTTLGEHLRSCGYNAFGTGKWHNGRSSFARSFSAGDEIFFGGMFDHWNVPAYRFDPSGKYGARCPYVHEPWRSNKLDFKQCDHIHAGRHSTELFTETASRFLRDYGESEPFFTYVSLMAPHDPRTMPEKFLKMYNPADIQLPDNFVPEHGIDTGALKIRDEMLAAFPRDPDEIKRHIAEYYAMISHLDDGFGRVMAALEKAGKLENTIVVFAGDNGLAVGRHGLMGKQNLYDHSVRVPLVFAGPGIPKGERRESLVYLLDIMPTLCDLADVKTPGSVEGRSLVPCLDNANAGVRDSLYLAYAESIRGVTDGSRKLIEYACGETQLFDLENDPSEKRNLADAGESGEILKRMRRETLALAEEWDDESHPTGKAFWKQRSDLKQ
ncbi:MAG: sulfatase-like hydrolase/transferase [Kiritimatiellia bacterium]